MEREKFDRNKQRKDISTLGASSEEVTPTTKAALERNLSREAALLHALFSNIDDIIDMDWDAIYALPTIEEMERAVAEKIRDKQLELSQKYGSMNAVDDPELVDLMDSPIDDKSHKTM